MAMRAAAVAALLVGALTTPPRAEPATADRPLDVTPLVRNERIQIEYVEPRHPIYAYYTDPDDPAQAEDHKTNVATYKRYMAIMERLKARQVLEKFSQFLAPLKLPITLRLRAMQCGEVNAFYDPTDSSINLCYEFVADIEDRAPREKTPEGITRDEVIIGQIVGTLLHEGGHAVSNLLRLPVLGREEDTADQIAAFIMLQFGRDVARMLIKGETYGWNQRQRMTSRFWGPHSTALQRQHTFLCLAYGSDPRTFEDFVRIGWLPKQRAANCAQEYEQVRHAFRETILPHIDIALAKKMPATILPWLGPADAK
jgi:Putative metallopeptidase